MVLGKIARRDANSNTAAVHRHRQHSGHRHTVHSVYSLIQAQDASLRQQRDSDLQGANYVWKGRGGIGSSSRTRF